MKPWFRMYAEFASDPKVQLLSFDDQRHYIVLLCLKCNGTLDSASPSPEFHDRMIAKGLGLDCVTASEVRRRLQEVGIIDSGWHPVKWDSRQYESDSSAERTRAWRERQKETSQERHGDVTVTDKNRTEQSRERVAKRSRRAPREFEPDLAYAASQIADIDAAAEARKFMDWEFKTPRSDWPAVWRNWIGTCKENGRYVRKASERWQ